MFRSRFLGRSLFAITLSILPLELLADDYLTEEDILGEIPVVTSASHFPQKISNAPASMTIIDRDMIEASGAIEVTELFKLVPGFQAYSPSGSFPTVNYRTFPAHFPGYLEVKVDGRSVYEVFLNTVVWPTLGLELEDIDYIEVVRGSNTPADGSNAFNGSINIVTRSAVNSQGLSVRSRLGDLNTRDLSMTYGGVIDDFAYKITASHRSNEGFPNLSEKDFNDRFPDLSYTAIDDDLQSNSIGFRGTWTPTLFDTLDIQIGASNSHIGMSQANRKGEPDRILPWKFEYNYQYINWQHQIDNDNQLTVLFYHNDQQINVVAASAMFTVFSGGLPPTLFYPDSGLDDFLVTQGINDGGAERYDLEVRHSGKFTEKTHFSWGLATRYDRAKSVLFFTQEDAVDEQFHRVFSNIESNITDNLVLNGGVIYERSGTSGEHHSYRLASNYHLNSSNTIRAVYNNVTRAPTLLAADEFRTISHQGYIFNIDRVSADDIKEEELESYELGYYGNFLEGRISIDIKFFKEYNDDLIETWAIKRDYPGDFDGKVAFRDNTMWIDTKGVELQMQYRPDQHWLASFQYSYQHPEGVQIREYEIASDSFITKPLKKSAPSNIVNLLVNYKTNNGYSLGGSFYYQSLTDWKLGYPVEKYDRIDLHLGKDILFNSSKAHLELVVQNAFGNHFEEYQNYNLFETRYFAKMSIDF